jgi:ABC-type polysaccharide transport system permease subunit
LASGGVPGDPVIPLDWIVFHRTFFLRMFSEKARISGIRHSCSIVVLTLVFSLVGPACIADMANDITQEVMVTGYRKN